MREYKTSPGKRTYSREYARKNAKRIAERDKATRLAHPERERKKTLRKQSPEAKAKRRAYYEEHKEIIAPKRRAYRQAHAAEIREKRLLKHFGITGAQLEAMIQAQGGRCAICQESASLHLDHCHATGKVRGLLCPNCNKALGLFKDQRSRLLAAADYVGGAA